MLQRQSIIDALSASLASRPGVRAAWLGGSDATGRTDALSDIDLVAIADDDAVEDAFDAVERALAGLSPIEHRFRLPMPTWHGHEQAIYRLQGTPPCLLIDLAVMAAASPPDRRFLERERHGEPLILFDRAGLVVPAPFDRPAHAEKMRRRLADLRVRFPLFQCLVTKAIERNQPVDAAYFYHGFTLMPVVEALRMLHCPDRYDFGMRYVKNDLPPEAYGAIERLALYGDLGGLLTRQREAEGLFAAALARLDAKAAT